MYHLFRMYRACFPLEGAAGVGSRASFPWDSSGICGIVACVTFLLGYKIFVSAKGMFPDEV
jgi:hypothetical protein